MQPPQWSYTLGITGWVYSDWGFELPCREALADVLTASKFALRSSLGLSIRSSNNYRCSLSFYKLRFFRPQQLSGFGLKAIYLPVGRWKVHQILRLVLWAPWKFSAQRMLTWLPGSHRYFWQKPHNSVEWYWQLAGEHKRYEVRHHWESSSPLRVGFEACHRTRRLWVFFPAVKGAICIGYFYETKCAGGRWLRPRLTQAIQRLQVLSIAI